MRNLHSPLLHRFFICLFCHHHETQHHCYQQSASQQQHCLCYYCHSQCVVLDWGHELHPHAYELWVFVNANRFLRGVGASQYHHYIGSHHSINSNLLQFDNAEQFVLHQLHKFLNNSNRNSPLLPSSQHNPHRFSQRSSLCHSHRNCQLHLLINPRLQNMFKFIRFPLLSAMFHLGTYNLHLALQQPVPSNLPHCYLF